MSADDLKARLLALAERQKDLRGDMLYLGQPDPEIIEAADRIATLEAEVERLRGGMARALAVADKGVSSCPINNGWPNVDPRGPCPRCQNTQDESCPSIDAANDRAVGIIRAALKGTDPAKQENTDAD